MIGKLIETSWYKVENESITYINEPLKTGSFLVYIKTPLALQNLLDDPKEAEDLLITSVKSVDVPSSAIVYEPLQNGRQLMTNIPVGREGTYDVNIVFNETIDCDVLSVLELWQSTISNPIHHTPLFNKPFGESYLNYIKTTITIFIFDPTILKRLKSSLIIKLYGASIENLDKAGLNANYDTTEVAQITASFKCDRIVPLTRSIASVYGMGEIFDRSEKLLLSTIEDAQKNSFQMYAQQLKEMIDVLSKVTETGGVTK